MKSKFLLSVFLLFVSTYICADENDRINQSFFTGSLAISPVPLAGQRSNVKLSIVSDIDDCRNITINSEFQMAYMQLAKTHFLQPFCP